MQPRSGGMKHVDSTGLASSPLFCFMEATDKGSWRSKVATCLLVYGEKNSLAPDRRRRTTWWSIHRTDDEVRCIVHSVRLRGGMSCIGLRAHD